MVLCNGFGEVIGRSALHGGDGLCGGVSPGEDNYRQFGIEVPDALQHAEGSDFFLPDFLLLNFFLPDAEIEQISPFWQEHVRALRNNDVQENR